MLTVTHYKDPVDTSTFNELVFLYGEQPIAPVLHQALTGSGMHHVFVVLDSAFATMDGPIDAAPGVPVAAGILSTPEAVVPLGRDINPIAWVVSDMMTLSKFRRRGAAMVLLKHMEGVVTRNGGRIIYLYTESDNEPAMRLYEKAGYQRLGNQKDKAVYAKLITE